MADDSVNAGSAAPYAGGGGDVAPPRRKRQRGPRHGHTLRGLQNKTTLTWQQKLELEDLQRRRSRMLATGHSPPRNAAGRTRTADDDTRDFEPPSPYKTTEVSLKVLMNDCAATRVRSL